MNRRRFLKSAAACAAALALPKLPVAPAMGGPVVTGTWALGNYSGCFISVGDIYIINTLTDGTDLATISLETNTEPANG